MKYYLSLILALSAFLYNAAVYGQDFAKEQLENSPRHHEWAAINANDRTLHTFVAYPESSEKTMAVVVIHENRGLNDWARSFTDQLAAKGYLAVAPDLLSGASEKYEKTSEYPSSDDARSAIYALDGEKVTTDLKAAVAYAKNLPACNGKVAVVGFCWGGSQSFRFATDSDEIEAALVFYGTAPKDKTELKEISVPVYGFYGGKDERVNSTIDATAKAMNQYDKKYEYKIFDGAGHAFMRRGDNPETASQDPNKVARDKAWDRMTQILEQVDK